MRCVAARAPRPTGARITDADGATDYTRSSDRDDAAAMLHAARWGHVDDLVRLLKQTENDTEIKDKNGYTLALIAARGRLSEEAPEGAMLAVAVPADRAAAAAAAA